MLKKINQLILLSNEPKISKYIIQGIVNSQTYSWVHECDPMILAYFYLGYLTRVKPDQVLDLDLEFLRYFFIGYMSSHKNDANTAAMQYIFGGYILLN